MTRRYESWEPDQLALLRGLRAEGMSYAEAAIELGVSKSAVAGQLHRLRHPAQKKKRRVVHSHAANARLKASKAPFAPDCSSYDFARDDDHVEVCMAAGGFPVLQIKARR